MEKIRLCWGGCPYPGGKGRGAFCIFWDIHVWDQWGQQELAGPFPWFCRPRARAWQAAEAAAGVSVVGQGQESNRHARVTCQQGLWKSVSPPLQDKSRALAVFIIFWTLPKASVNDYICFLEWVKLLATQKWGQMFSSVTVKRRLLNRAAWADEGSALRALRSLLRRFKNMKEEERAIATQRYQNQPHVAA